jgi:Fe2+ transport system protein FeoA
MAEKLDVANRVARGKDQGRRRWRWRGRRMRGRRGDVGCAGVVVGAEMRLSEARVGSRVIVTGVFGDEVFRGRIMAMGIVPGVRISVAHGGARQPLVVALPGRRCVLDRRSTAMIEVRECPVRDGEGRMAR